MEPEILKAMPKPAAIKRIVFYVAIGIVVISFGKTIFFPWLKNYVSINDKAEALFRFKMVMFGISTSLLPFIIYLSVIAKRIIKSQQFPSPGTQVLRDTHIVRGKKAIFHGVAIALAAVWLLGCAIYAVTIPYTLSHHHESTSGTTKQDASQAQRSLP